MKRNFPKSAIEKTVDPAVESRVSVVHDDDDLLNRIDSAVRLFIQRALLAIHERAPTSDVVEIARRAVAGELQLRAVVNFPMTGVQLEFRDQESAPWKPLIEITTSAGRRDAH